MRRISRDYSYQFHFFYPLKFQKILAVWQPFFEKSPNCPLYFLFIKNIKKVYVNAFYTYQDLHQVRRTNTSATSQKGAYKILILIFKLIYLFFLLSMIQLMRNNSFVKYIKQFLCSFTLCASYSLMLNIFFPLVWPNITSISSENIVTV